MLSIYHAVDLNRRQFDFTCGWSARPPASLPEPLSAYQLTGGRALRVRHVGRYEHLANAWNGAYQFARYRKLKPAPKDSIEVYANPPETTAAADLVTDVFLRLR
jgi:DNA gyrase inhibitor GyrI